VYAAQVEVGREIADYLLKKYGPTPSLDDPTPRSRPDAE
jgi:hypothetical protein